MSDYQKQLKNYIDLSGYLSASYNLNDGLPWTNPLKIGIGSDQHILDTTINRGLMMLLNNDYYMDAKQTLISKQISGLFSNTNLLHKVLSEHIADDSVHGTSRITYNNYIISGGSDVTTSSGQKYNNATAIKDYIVYLPISWSVAQINTKIASIPHNLNGHTVVFMFVIPNDFQPLNTTLKCGINVDLYSLDVGNSCISFTNFVNRKYVYYWRFSS